MLPFIFAYFVIIRHVLLVIHLKLMATQLMYVYAHFVNSKVNNIYDVLYKFIVWNSWNCLNLKFLMSFIFSYLHIIILKLHFYSNCVLHVKRCSHYLFKLISIIVYIHVNCLQIILLRWIINVRKMHPLQLILIVLLQNYNIGHYRT